MSDIETADSMIQRHKIALKNGGDDYCDLLEEHKVCCLCFQSGCVFAQFLLS
jgi:hypothetical protein